MGLPSAASAGATAHPASTSRPTGTTRPTRPTGSRAGRRERQRVTYQQNQSFLERYRTPLIVVAAVVSPYRATRDEVRGMLPEGTFLEVFVDTPIEICEARDVKGWYAKARSGEVTGLTGIDDPYEPPISPELRLETVGTTVDANAQRVLELLVRRGDLAPG